MPTTQGRVFYSLKKNTKNYHYRVKLNFPPFCCSRRQHTTVLLQSRPKRCLVLEWNQGCVKTVAIFITQWQWCFNRWVAAAGCYWMPVKGRCSFLVLRVSSLGLTVSDPLLPDLWREVPALPFLLTLVPFATVQPSPSPPWNNKLRKKSTYTNKNSVVLSCYSWIYHLPAAAHI